MNPPSERRARLARMAVDLAVLGLLAAVALYIRRTGLFTDAFHNEDVAGITYNADLLRAGGLPYKDDLEWKAPGSFYMVWGIWEVFGRSLIHVQRFMAGWAWLAAVGVYAGGIALYGRKVGAVAALLYAFGSPIADSIDVNYGAWMITPYVWCTVFAIVALKRGTLRGWIAAGATLAAAGLLKRQAAVLFPLFALLIVAWPRLRAPDGWRGPPRRIPALAAFGGGLALGFAPILVHAAAHGGLGDVVRHYFLSESGWRYVADSPLSAMDKLVRVGDGVLGFWEYMALPTVLAGLTALHTLASGEARRLGVRGVLLAGHFGLSFVGAALGFRFFKGYYLQILPAAVWLAAHPRGPLVGWWPPYRIKLRWRTLLWGALIVGLAVPAFQQDLEQVESIHKRRRAPRDREAAQIGRVIAQNTAPTDRIWVWGRWAWPVYYHADRLAPGRFYKVLGVLTNNLTNTWRRPTKKTEFTLDSPWKAVTAELVEGRPAFIAVSRNEGYRDWKAFKSLLRKEYQRIPQVGGRGIKLYKRKDHPWVKEPRKRARRRGRSGRRPRPKTRPPKTTRPPAPRLGPVRPPKPPNPPKPAAPKPAAPKPAAPKPPPEPTR